MNLPHPKKTHPEARPETSLLNRSRLAISRSNNTLLVLATIALTVFPLIFVRGDYGGTDDQATQLVQELNPNYQPWFQPPLTPVSDEVESLLFVCQAALGAGILGYGMGWYRGRYDRAQTSAAPLPPTPDPTEHQDKS